MNVKTESNHRGRQLSGTPWNCLLCDFEGKEDFRPVPVQMAEHAATCPNSRQKNDEVESNFSTDHPSRLHTFHQGFLSEADTAGFDPSQAYDWAWVTVRDDRPRACWGTTGAQGKVFDQPGSALPWAQ